MADDTIGPTCTVAPFARAAATAFSTSAYVAVGACSSPPSNWRTIWSSAVALTATTVSAMRRPSANPPAVPTRISRFAPSWINSL